MHAPDQLETTLSLGNVLSTLWILAAFPGSVTVAIIARDKGYNAWRWFLWGLLFGIFALAVIMARSISDSDYRGKH